MDDHFNEVDVTMRKRSPREQAVIDLLQARVAHAADEHVDTLFVQVLTSMQNLGYNLQAAPLVLLAQVKAAPEAEQTPRNILRHMLSITANEDLDVLFVDTLTFLQDQGQKFEAAPTALLAQINGRHA